VTPSPPFDSRKQLQLALAAYGEGQLEAAARIVQELLAIRPADVEGHFAMGMILAAAGDLVSAIAHIREALRFEPRFAPAIERLAVLLVEIHDYAGAEKYAHRGLLSDPGNFDCLIVLGRCLAQRGEDAAALDRFRMAKLVRPREAQPHIQSGRILQKQYRLEEALAELQVAASLDPGSETQIEYAELQAFVGQRAEAAHSFSRAVESSPQSFEANILAARSLIDLNLGHQAGPYWDQAEALEPVRGQTRLAKALALSLAGQFEESREEALRAIEQNPTLGKPYNVLFASKRATPDDQPMIDQIEDVLRGDIREADRIDLLYTLGKVYDNLGEYAMAMSNLDKANSHLHTQAFDREEFRRTVDLQIEIFTKTNLCEVGASESDLPLFVTGMIRSGTTLVDQILSCHPQVGSGGELGFWSQNEPLAVDYEGKKIRPEATALTHQYRGLLRLLAPGKPHVIDKNPANFLLVGLLHTLFPSARIISTRRHAVDTALSIWMTPMQTNAPFVFDKADIVYAYKEFLRLAEHWREALPESRYMEVRYENMIADAESESRRLIEFCGLPWDSACLRPEENTRAVRTPSFWQVRQPVYRTSVDRWRNYEPWLGPFAELIGL